MLGREGVVNKTGEARPKLRPKLKKAQDIRHFMENVTDLFCGAKGFKTAINLDEE